ncbi:MAG: preprotein translocase subunit SecY [Planctomycetota bacterium]|jgi:preprotein translocase subunit SecY
MLGTIFNIFKVPDLRNKILFTVALLVIYRIGFHIPVPCFDQAAMAAAAQMPDEGPLGRITEMMQMFSGGTLSKSSVFALGIMPYITASIILMLLGEVIPALKKLRQEGMTGHKKVQEYTRYLTVPICIIQSFGFMKLLMGGYIYAGMETQALIMGIVCMTAGTIFLMWLGEQIDEYGIGNGISLIIMAGIISRMPWAIQELWKDVDFRVSRSPGAIGPEKILFLILAFVFVVAGAILITQGQRRIPIQQAKQIRGRRTYGGQRSYLPLRVNHGGVMPIIFASAFMMFPSMIISWLGNIPRLQNSAVLGSIVNALAPGAYTYSVLYMLLIFAFTYFWVTVQFQPKEMAKNLRDSGSFIPGLRPGRRTAEYLETVMTRVTYFGATFLAIIAVVPSVVSILLGVDWRIASFLGGTGLLIVVSVSLDLVQKIEANLLMHSYEGFSEAGRIKGAYG